MRWILGIVAGFLFMAPPPTRADEATVGFHEVRGVDYEGVPLELAIWYPSATPAAPHRLGPFTQAVSLDAPVIGKDLPLVVMSHGSAGAPWSHYDTALALAVAGFVVVAPTHLGDTHTDRRRAAAVLDRIWHITGALDFMLSRWASYDTIDSHRIGVFGFSAGGFAGLVTLGGAPDFSRLMGHCQEHPAEFACATAAPVLAEREFLEAPPTTHRRDDRIRAAVIAAPALGFTFTPERLARVTVAVQLWRAGQDTVTPHPFHAEAVRQALPRPPHYRIESQAGHFDFLAPCTARLAAVADIICRESQGFDRAAFHDRFNREVVAFFRRELERRP